MQRIQFLLPRSEHVWAGVWTRPPTVFDYRHESRDNMPVGRFLFGQRLIHLFDGRLHTSADESGCFSEQLAKSPKAKTAPYHIELTQHPALA